MGFKNRWPGSDDDEDHSQQPYMLRYRHATRQIERKAELARAPKPSAPKPTRPQIAPRPRVDRGRNYEEGPPRKSMSRATKELLCDYPGIKVEALMAKLERQGYEAAQYTIEAIRKDFLETIKVARELGYIRLVDPE